MSNALRNITAVATAQPGLVATFKQDDGTYEEAPVVAWLVYTNGTGSSAMAGVVDNETGELEPVDAAANFAGLRNTSQVKPA